MFTKFAVDDAVPALCHSEHGKIPGFAICSISTCFYEYGDLENQVNVYELFEKYDLCDDVDPKDEYLVGHQTHEDIDVWAALCQNDEGDWMPGKVWNNRCWATLNHKSYNSQKYRTLIVSEMGELFEKAPEKQVKRKDPNALAVSQAIPALCNGEHGNIPGFFIQAQSLCYYEYGDREYSTSLFQLFLKSDVCDDVDDNDLVGYQKNEDIKVYAGLCQNDDGIGCQVKYGITDVGLLLTINLIIVKIIELYVTFSLLVFKSTKRRGWG